MGACTVHMRVYSQIDGAGMRRPLPDVHGWLVRPGLCVSDMHSQKAGGS